MERAAGSEHWSEIQDWIWGERADVLAFSGRLKEARTMSQRAVEVALEADRRESAAQHEAASAVREALFGNMLDARRRVRRRRGFRTGWTQSMERRSHSPFQATRCGRNR